MVFSYQYPRAALTVDCVVLGFDEGELKVLLIQRALRGCAWRSSSGQTYWRITAGFIFAELRSPRYHGVFARSVNPRLTDYLEGRML